MPKKTSNKQGNASKPASRSRGKATNHTPCDLATFHPHPDPEVPPTLPNEPSHPINTNRNDAEPTSHSNQVPTNQVVPAQLTPASSDGAPSVKTVDSNDNTIDHTFRAANDDDRATDADEDDGNYVGSDEEVSESIPVADIQWEEYSYDSAAEEHKSQSSDPVSFVPPPQAPMPNRQVPDVQDGTFDHGRKLNEEEDFYFGSGCVRSGQNTEDEEVAIQLQFDEYKAASEPPGTVPPEAPEATTVFESLERIRKEVVLKLQEMEDIRKVDKEEQAHWNGRIATNQSSIDKLTSHITDTKALLESLVEKKSIFCGENHLIAVCPLAGSFVSKVKNPLNCLYCGKGGHIMADCVHASDFILKISKATYQDDSSTHPEDDIDVDSNTSKDLYECLTDGQIDTLTTNPNIWQPG
jgi:hypothetical protein